eukprot:3429797-Pyramimonas_sp.AAC.2
MYTLAPEKVLEYASWRAPNNWSRSCALQYHFPSIGEVVGAAVGAPMGAAVYSITDRRGGGVVGAAVGAPIIMGAAVYSIVGEVVGAAVVAGRQWAW